MIKRNRYLYIFYIFLTILLGLASREYGYFLPEFLAEYAGDAFWSLMVFFIIGFVFNKLPSVKVAGIAILFSFLIEFSQLYQADWIENIRKTILGALVLGRGFLWSDLVCYTFGISMGLMIEVITLRKKYIFNKLIP